MKSFLFTLITIFLLVNSYSQGEYAIVEIQPGKKIKLPYRKFYISNVIDNRENTESIGYYSKKYNPNKKTDLRLNGDLSKQVLSYYNELLPQRPNDNPIVAKINQLKCYNRTSISQYTIINFEIVFYSKEESEENELASFFFDYNEPFRRSNARKFSKVIRNILNEAIVKLNNKIGP